jgi:hypothetical protein
MDKDSNSEFHGTASDLLKVLSNSIPESQRKAKGWPKRPNALSRILRRIAPPLRKVGIDVKLDRNKHGSAIAITARVAQTSSSASPSSFRKDGNGLEQLRHRHPIVTSDDDPG